MNHLNCRIKTEELYDYDYESQLKEEKLQFRQFRNISEATMSNFNREKGRKKIKMDVYKATKF